ncbi:hypothetical protein SPAP_1163 [Streptococcus pneumoniae AP200]|nr:hypothetical protein SPAP_1163 [Streptococcus pneumoniae AP200]
MLLLYSILYFLILNNEFSYLGLLYIYDKRLLLKMKQI